MEDNQREAVARGWSLTPSHLSITLNTHTQTHTGSNALYEEKISVTSVCRQTNGQADRYNVCVPVCVCAAVCVCQRVCEAAG